MRFERWRGRNERSGFVRGVVERREDNVEDDEDGANGDSGVGDVKSGPAVRTEPDFEEIRDGSVKDAVGDVASSAAKNQSEASGGHGTARFQADEQPGDDADDHSGAQDKQRARRERRMISKNAESNTRIAAVHKIDEVVNDFVSPAFGSLRFEPGFGGAVEEDDDECEPKVAQA